MIPREFISDLNERVDMVELVGAHVKLTRSGANWMGLCPFHTEKTPSFAVVPGKGFYHCFGCGAHGTAIGFVMQYYAMEFVAAVEKLAAMQGMKVPRVGGGGGDDGRRAEGAALLGDAMRFFCRQLKESEAAQAYLRRRGMTGETAARYQVGYAPGGWEGLKRQFAERERALVEVGLLRVVEGEGREGRSYDYFRDRIMFPIMDSGERVCGFGGRALGGGEEPKYLNSPESRFFAKRRLLYGAPQAARAARDSKRVIVCEGYMDVAMLAQAGFGEAVATMGTAATVEQMRRAMRLAPNVYLAYDGDEAGQSAARRALEGILAALRDGVGVFFLFLPAGHDPDSYVRDHGADGFVRLLAEAMPLGDFLGEALRRETAATGVEGQATGVARTGGEMLRQVSAEEAPAWRDILQKKLGDVTGVSEAVIARRAAPRAAARPTKKSAYRMARESLLFQLLCCIAQTPALVERLPHDLPLPGARQDAALVGGVLTRLRRGGEEVEVAAMLAAAGYVPLARQVREAIKGRYEKAVDAEGELQMIVARLREKHQQVVRSAKSELVRKINEALKGGE